MEAITLSSPAKVNLYLKILGKRPDGFHELETVMAALSLADEMQFEVRPGSITLECDAPGVPTDKKNLAVRAARLLQERFGKKNPGVHIAIRKRIPVGGGMGGGSSNAATTLLALNQLWDINAPAGDLQPLAAALGSDVPFFLQPSVALCRGRGEIIEPLRKGNVAALDGRAVVLLNPGFGVSTPWAYRSYAARGGAAAEEAREIASLRDALQAGDIRQVGAQLYNSLETPVFHKYPILEMFKQSLQNAGAAGALMSGSGATVFGVCENVAQAEAVREQIAATFGMSLWTYVARFALGA